MQGLFLCSAQKDNGPKSKQNFLQILQIGYLLRKREPYNSKTRCRFFLPLCKVILICWVVQSSFLGCSKANIFILSTLKIDVELFKFVQVFQRLAIVILSLCKVMLNCSKFFKLFKVIHQILKTHNCHSAIVKSDLELIKLLKVFQQSVQRPIFVFQPLWKLSF